MGPSSKALAYVSLGNERPAKSLIWENPQLPKLGVLQRLAPWEAVHLSRLLYTLI